MMKKTHSFLLKDKMIKAFEENKKTLFENNSEYMTSLREKVAGLFSETGFPDQSIEQWRYTNLTEVLNRDYKLMLKPPVEKIDLHSVFKCNIHQLETYMFAQLNGWHVAEDEPIKIFDDGTIIGSLAAAMIKYPELFESNYGRIAITDENGFVSLNTAFAQDGIFIYVPDNVKVEKAIQMINITNLNENIFVQPRNLIILGKNSELTLVHCDDSVQHKTSLINTVTEINVGENAFLDYYKLQNKDDQSTVITSTYVNQDRSSKFNANTITLNGGIIRNNINVKLDGEGSESNIYGLYLMDKNQHVDNQVYIDHAKANCYSNELFKGIIDDNASAVFNGHVLVRKDSQNTNAFQTNKNVLLTGSAKVTTKPFLEIYADDVKCTHGATVGLLDMDSLFYIRSRGISEKNAKILLMYAFAAEVINKMSIIALRNRLDDLVKKRLRGELSICEECVLHCSNPEHAPEFDIDISKI